MRTSVNPSSRLAIAAVAALALAGCGDGGDEQAAPPAGSSAPARSSEPAATDPAGQATSASFVGPDGAELGTVELREDGGVTTVTVEVSDLEPGFHGFHVHMTGQCEPDSPDPADPAKTGDFLSAGGHLAEEGEVHGEHLGDLPSLFVGQDGTASLTTTIDRLGLDDVLDEDGSAVMIHAMPDNFGNVPDRYAPGGVDETTDKTGDAGGRVGCAALTADG